MKLLSRIEGPRALLLDFDSTLYTNGNYARFQNEVLIERLARERGESLEATKARLDALRAELAAASGTTTSLGQLFAQLGVSIETSVTWREELIEPATWLGPDPVLDAVLAILASRFALALVTNNPASVGKKGLDALGVARHFKTVVGLDDTWRSKPDPAPYVLAAKRLDTEAGACISIGDRYDIDIAPALSLGMGAILVDGVEDIYRLPELLAVSP
jgi:phosphoglycolate phosphatase/putative hydrolase of the HAD superfamily